MAEGANFLIEDGIILWFDGPEWDEVALEAFNDAKDEIVGAAQRDAPWADRTGDARAGLEATVEEDNGEIVLNLYHTVDYGLWLEVIQNGNYATIMPTLENYGPKVMAQAEAAVAKARQGRDYA